MWDNIHFSNSNTLPHVWATNMAQHMHTILIKRGRWQINIEHLLYYHVKFLYINWTIDKRVMRISLNEVLFQNQLAMGGVTHKLMYMLKPSDSINVGQHPLSYLCIVFHQCGTIPKFHTLKALCCQVMMQSMRAAWK